MIFPVLSLIFFLPHFGAFFTVLGNHDYMGDALCQLSEEIAKRDPRWFCRKEFQLHVPLSCIDDSDMTLTEGDLSILKYLYSQ